MYRSSSPPTETQLLDEIIERLFAEHRNLCDYEDFLEHLHRELSGQKIQRYRPEILRYFNKHCPPAKPLKVASKDRCRSWKCVHAVAGADSRFINTERIECQSLDRLTHPANEKSRDRAHVQAILQDAKRSSTSAGEEKVPRTIESIKPGSPEKSRITDYPITASTIDASRLEKGTMGSDETAMDDPQMTTSSGRWLRRPGPGASRLELLVAAVSAVGELTATGLWFYSMLLAISRDEAAADYYEQLALVVLNALVLLSCLLVLARSAAAASTARARILFSSRDVLRGFFVCMGGGVVYALAASDYLGSADGSNRMFITTMKFAGAYAQATGALVMFMASRSRGVDETVLPPVKA